MGGSQSSRVTVINDEKENAISVTRGVVERIKGEETPTKVIEQPRPIRKREKASTEHFEKIADQNDELKLLLSKNLAISEPTYMDEKTVASPELCADKRQDIFSCLQDNKSEPLKCSTEMSEFTKCVYSALDDRRKSIV